MAALAPAVPPARRSRAPHASIGVVFPGDPAASTTWSGTPAGLIRGLREHGLEPVALRAAPAPRVEWLLRTAAAARRVHRTRRSLRAARAIARLSPELAVVYGRSATRAVASARVDAVIQIGTGYSIGGSVPVATFEDLTVRQAFELGYPEWLGLSRREVDAAISRQRRAYEHARAVCMTTDWAADSVVRDYGIDPAKVHAVGVARNHEPVAATRDWSSPRFLFVGKDWHGKNGDALLRAFARVRETLPEARLELVGHHPPVSQAGVEGHGFLRLDSDADRRRLERLYAESTCFVLPSRFEASALAYVEAMAAGLPVIATTRGGSSYLVGDAGRLVDPEDGEALVAAMLELARPLTAEALGRRAESRAELFTWHAVVGRILRALEP